MFNRNSRYLPYSMADGPRGLEMGTMATDNVAATGESLDGITDALLTASRLLVAISARSISQVDDSITIPQFRTLVILSNQGAINLATLANLLGVQPSATGRMVDRLV